MPVRVGVIGIGYLGQHHVRIYSELENTELVAVVDAVEKRA
ncbi:MAG: gfo/Idh/MocA family oxidoreductase, partial [Nitrospirae bacterium]|nr:gfo/Idh/MocA family oxidoreductase [Nitrospirota bacterium]